MDLYVILRRNGWRTPEDLEEAAARSAEEGDKDGSGVRWIRSYVLAGGERRARHRVHLRGREPRGDPRARRRGRPMPADEIIPVADTVIVRPDPVAGAPPEAPPPGPAAVCVATLCVAEPLRRHVSAARPSSPARSAERRVWTPSGGGKTDVRPSRARAVARARGDWIRACAPWLRAAARASRRRGRRAAGGRAAHGARPRTPSAGRWPRPMPGRHVRSRLLRRASRSSRRTGAREERRDRRPSATSSTTRPASGSPSTRRRSAWPARRSPSTGPCSPV